MTCAAYEPLIALLAEGDLPAGERADVEAHLAECAACRAFAEALADSQRAIHELAAEDLDPQVLAAVRSRVSSALGPPSLPSRTFAGRLRPIWALAAAAAIVVMAFLVQRRDPGTSAPAPPPLAEVPPPTTTAPAVDPPVVSPPASVAARVMEGASRPVRTRARGPAQVTRDPAVTPQASPLLIKLVTSDPDVVIYWLVEQNGGES